MVILQGFEGGQSVVTVAILNTRKDQISGHVSEVSHDDPSIKDMLEKLAA
jgi:hypothetical protein